MKHFNESINKTATRTKLLYESKKEELCELATSYSKLVDERDQLKIKAEEELKNLAKEADELQGNYAKMHEELTELKGKNKLLSEEHDKLRERL